MPAWRWFEQCVAVELVQKHLKLNGELPAFYNIMLERSKDCPEGYDLVFVDASDIGNFASRLSHSCSPNCASRVAVVNGKFAIQMRTIKDVIPGEELVSREIIRLLNAHETNSLVDPRLSREHRQHGGISGSDMLVWDSGMSWQLPLPHPERRLLENHSSGPWASRTLGDDSRELRE